MADTGQTSHPTKIFRSFRKSTIYMEWAQNYLYKMHYMSEAFDIEATISLGRYSIILIVYLHLVEFYF